MNGTPIARSIYYTTIKSNKVNGDSTKNRGSLLRHPPEDSASISSHYTLTSFAYQRYARATLISTLYRAYFCLQHN